MQNFEPTGAAAAMPGSAVPQIKRRLVISACLLIPLFYLGLGAAFGLPLPPFLTGDNAMWCGIVQLVLTVPVCWLNRSYFINGCKSIRAPGPDTLVALSSGAALVYGIIAIFTQDAPQELFLPSAAAILIFAAACQLLEVRFKAQAMAPLHSLAERIPETACVLRSRQQYTVPLNEVAVGDIFLIRPGDVMPVDGVVIEGETTVDESALTGAAAPVAKHKGSTVYAATANQGGALICRATRIGSDSTAAQLVHTVQTTAAAKVPLSSLADKVRSVFVPAVIGIACVVLIIWLLLGQSFAFALARAISVLAVSSPCVLALAASAAIMSGASVGAKHGIVFKTAASLQSIGTLHTAVLDKAGTITNGEPEVVTIVGTRSVPAKFLLGMAAGLESQSQDPLARAVMRKAAAENIKLSAVKDVTILDGQGLTGKMAGKVMAGGSAEFIAAQCELTPDLQQAGEQLAADGIAPLYFSLDGHAAGLIGVADAVKPASKAALDALKALLAQFKELFLVLALAVADDGGQQIGARALGQFGHAVDHVLNLLRLDRQAGRGAIGRARPRKQQPQIVVDFRHRADGRARVLGRGLLLDGDRRGQAADMVHIRLAHHVQKLARIGRQAFDIAPLPLGIDGVKGQAGFAAARQAGDHHQLVARNVHVHVLQIVFARPANLDELLFHRHVPITS